MIGVDERVVEEVVEDRCDHGAVGERGTVVTRLDRHLRFHQRRARSCPRHGVLQCPHERDCFGVGGQHLSLHARHREQFVGEQFGFLGFSLRGGEGVLQRRGQATEGAFQRHSQVAAGDRQWGTQLVDGNAHELALRLLGDLGLGDQPGVAKQESAERGELLQRLHRGRVKRLIGFSAHRK